MSRSVWKFPIPVDDEWHEVTIPLPGRVVNVDAQGAYGTVMIWAEVTTDSAVSVTQHYRVFGTGQQITNDAVYVGSTVAGPFVWHVYTEAQG